MGTVLVWLVDVMFKEGFAEELEVDVGLAESGTSEGWSVPHGWHLSELLRPSTPVVHSL